MPAFAVPPAPQPCRRASAFLCLPTAPRFEGSSPGAWPLPAIQCLRSLGISMQAGPSLVPARCRPGPVRASSPSAACLPLSVRSGILCISSAGSLSSQASAASVFVRVIIPSLGCYSCRAGGVPPAAVFRGDLSALADDDIESIFRSSSEERPLAKAKIGPAGPPPPTPANCPHGAVVAGPAVGEGPAGPAGPPAPTPATSKAPGPVIGSGAAADGLPRASRETLQLPSEEPSTWRQQLLPRLLRPKQALSFSFRRRLLACSTTSASRCRLRVCPPRPRDGDCQTDRSLPISGPLTAGGWLFLHAVSNKLPFASSAVHFFATFGRSHPLQCALRPLALARLRATRSPPQPGMSVPAITVRLPLPLTSALSAPPFILPPPCPLSSGLNSVLQQACGWRPVAWAYYMPTRQEKRRARQNQGLRPCCSRPLACRCA